MTNNAFTGRERMLPDFQTFVSFDIETTGLGKEAELIELGAVRVERGRITETFSSFVRPQNPIDLMITVLTGITDDMVADAPTPDEIVPDFCDFLGDDILLGHNILAFDCRVLEKYVLACGVTLGNDLFDTLRYVRYRCDMMPKPKDNRLTTLCDHFCINPETHHRAVADAEATAELLLCLKRYTTPKAKYLEEIQT